METIQVVLDEELLRGAEQAAKRSKMNRSALIRAALRAYLKTTYFEELERRDRAGYEKHPDTGDLNAWEGVVVWPDE